MAAAKRLLWSPSSRLDLIEIYGYFSRVASDEVAEQLLLEIEAAVERLKKHPLIGTPRFEILPDLRAAYTHPYTILYRLTNEGVEISRVVHERREPLSADGTID
jgi:plasmid stabilization system protein ParE